MNFKLLLSAACLLAVGCGSTTPKSPAGSRVFDFTFVSDTQGWVPGFADLPEAFDPTQYELLSRLDTLPSSTGSSKKALRSRGTNRSDDLFMFWRRQVTGLAPNANYTARFEVTIASNTPASAVGIGGSPGTSVYVKAGATTIEPQEVPVLEAGVRTLRMNVDIGSQSAGGSSAIVLGHVGIPNDSPVYVLKSLGGTASSMTFRTDSTGAAWLFVGTDSGFEGTTDVYFSQVKVTIL